MSANTKNKALLRSLALGMVLAGPLTLAGCATSYDDSSSATSSQKATGEAEAEAVTAPPVNCPAGTTPQPDGTCLQG